ncbi:MAG: TonB-dependent receptor [Pseudomonadota bacterium]|nr:TonB-dependent receptor [Pseudomonadota bacterium]
MDTLRLLGNYAYQESTDETFDQDAGNAPHHKLYARSQWEFLPKWYFNSQVNWVADRKRPFGDTRPDIKDYTTVDLTVRAEIVHDWEVAFSVRNLFDADAREPSPGPAIPNDLTLAGRSVFGEIRVSF